MSNNVHVLVENIAPVTHKVSEFDRPHRHHECFNVSSFLSSNATCLIDLEFNSNDDNAQYETMSIPDSILKTPKILEKKWMYLWKAPEFVVMFV